MNLMLWNLSFSKFWSLFLGLLLPAVVLIQRKRDKSRCFFSDNSIFPYSLASLIELQQSKNGCISWFWQFTADNMRRGIQSRKKNRASILRYNSIRIQGKNQQENAQIEAKYKPQTSMPLLRTVIDYYHSQKTSRMQAIFC